MKEYKGKLMPKLFWTLCGICAAWLVFSLVEIFSHSLFIAIIAGVVVIFGFLYKIYYSDNISVVLSDDKNLYVKRFGRIIKTINIDKYKWSEYSKYSNVKNIDDQDIYYVDSLTGQEEYLDMTNFSNDEYQEMLEILGAKNKNEEPIKVETIKK